MKTKKWILPAAVGALLLTLVAGILIGKVLPGGGAAEEISDWLEEPSADESGRLKEKNLELLGQLILLKKMLGEIDGDVVLLGPVGSQPVARGRLVWDAARMEGFIHAVQLGSRSPSGEWLVQGYFQGQRKFQSRVDGPDGEGMIQGMFRPETRMLDWDEFKLVHQDEQGTQEVVLVGKRSQ